MIASPFVGIAAITWALGGPLAVLIVFGSAAAVVGIIIGGVHLMDS